MSLSYQSANEFAHREKYKEVRIQKKKNRRELFCSQIVLSEHSCYISELIKWVQYSLLRKQRNPSLVDLYCNAVFYISPVLEINSMVWVESMLLNLTQNKGQEKQSCWAWRTTAKAVPNLWPWMISLWPTFQRVPS